MTTSDFLLHEPSPGDQPLPPGHKPDSNDRLRKHGFVPELALDNDERIGFMLSNKASLTNTAKNESGNAKLIACYRDLSPDGRPLPHFVSQKPSNTQTTADPAQEEAA